MAAIHSYWVGCFWPLVTHGKEFETAMISMDITVLNLLDKVRYHSGYLAVAHMKGIKHDIPV